MTPTKDTPAPDAARLLADSIMLIDRQIATTDPGRAQRLRLLEAAAHAQHALDTLLGLDHAG